MASRFSISAIFRAIDQMSAPIAHMQKQSKMFTKTLQTDFAKAQRQAMKFNENFSSGIKTGLLVGTGLAITGIGLIAKEGLKLASDLVEVQNVVDTTFKENSKQIDAWSKTALNSFGISELQAKKFSSVLGAMMKSSGISGQALVDMSESMAGLAGDFASFYNLKPEEAFEKIKSGISGETEPLKALGINMSVANMEAFALSQGIKTSWRSMTQAQQTLLRYNFLMKVSKDAQGDFAKTSQTFANQQRLLTVNFQQLSATIMSKVYPMFNKLFIIANKMLSSIDGEKVGSQIKSFIDLLINIAKAIYNIYKIIKPFIPLILIFIASWIAYQKAMFLVALATVIFSKANVQAFISMLPLIIAIGLLIGVVYLIIKNWHNLNNVQKGLIIGIGILVGVILGVIGVIKIWQIVQIALNIILTANPIGAIVVGIAALIAAIILLIVYWNQIIPVVQKFWDMLKGILMIMSPINAVIVITIEIVRQLIASWDKITDKFKSGDILGGIMEIGKVILTGILSPIQALFEMLGKLPIIGKSFSGIAENIGGFRNSLSGEKTVNPMNPSERSSLTREEKTSKANLTIKDETGKAKLDNKADKNAFNLKLLYSGKF